MTKRHIFPNAGGMDLRGNGCPLAEELAFLWFNIRDFFVLLFRFLKLFLKVALPTAHRRGIKAIDTDITGYKITLDIEGSEYPKTVSTLIQKCNRE